MESRINYSFGIVVSQPIRKRREDGYHMSTNNYFLSSLVTLKSNIKKGEMKA